MILGISVIQLYCLRSHERIQKFRLLGGWFWFFFKPSTYFTEGCKDLPRQAIGTKGPNCFSIDVSTRILRKHIYIYIATCDFQGGGDSGPLHPPLDPPIAHESIHKCELSVFADVHADPCVSCSYIEQQVYSKALLN